LPRLTAVRALALGLAAFSVLGSSAPTSAASSNTVTVPRGWPKSVTIQKIGVKASVEAVDLSKASQVHAPAKWGDVAWYTRGPRPGEVGRASIYGHVDSTCCPAVFYKLKDLKAGDTVQVNYAKGRPLTFRVLWQGNFANTQLPIKFLYGGSTEHGLVLFTCSGVFHRDGTGYDHKLIVYARLVLPNGKLG